MKKSLSYLFHSLALVLMLNFMRCANVVSPSGGPKDTIPPIVLQSNPENQSTNFSEKEIHITFDEYVTLNNPNNNILISPPLENNPDYKLIGKSLIIKFKDPLKPETTYSINFGEVIKDLHEGNIFKDYSFVFSTGENIDTLSLNGKVLQADNHKPSADFFVMLYSDDNDTIGIDSLPFFVKPYYLTKSDKDGNFKFSGLKKDDYLIFALKDENSNLRFDLPNESIAFLDSLVTPSTIDNLQLVINNDSISNDTVKQVVKKDMSYTLYSFLEADTVQKLLKKEVPEEGLLRFVFSKPAQDVRIEVLESLPDSFAICQTYSANYDSILWYFTPNKDSLFFAINYDTLINDTSVMSLKPRNNQGKRKKETAVKSLAVSTNVIGSRLKPKQDLLISFKEPVTKIMMRDTSWYIVDKDTIINDLHFVKIDSFGLKYRLNRTFETEKSIKSSFQIRFFIVLKEQQTTLRNFLLEWHRHPPGVFGKKQLPESVYYHKDVFDVKANWDIDLEEIWRF